MTNIQAPLTILRASVHQLDQYEKLALACYLAGTTNPNFAVHIVPDRDGLSPDMEKAMEVTRLLPCTAKIFFAIELLELQIDRDALEDEDEDEELAGPREDPSITRAIDEVNAYTAKYNGPVDIDALPGFHQGY